MMTFKQLFENFVSAGMRETEAKIYAALVIKGRAGAGEIGRMIETSGQNVSISVKRLIEKNLIVKEGRNYALANPAGFSNFLQKENDDAVKRVEFQKNIGLTLSSIVNEAYMQSTGKPVVHILNLDEWKSFKNEMISNGNDKTMRIIRGKRVYSKNKKDRNETVSLYRKMGIYREIITPFFDHNIDKNENDMVFYDIKDFEFKKFDLDIYIKNDAVIINKRPNKDQTQEFRAIAIQNKKIAESFIELFNFLKKISKIQKEIR